MNNKMYEDVNEFVDELKEEFGEDGIYEDELRLWKELKGDDGVMLWIDNDGYESGVFVVNGDGEMFGFSGNNDSVKSYRLDCESVVGLLCDVLR